MKTIVCYGDSNTYGYDPHNGLRYDETLVWPSLLQSYAKDEYVVYNEGLNGRTTAYDRENSDERNGLTHLIPTLNKYKKIDVLIFMLGTNDCNYNLYLSLEDITNGMEKLIVTSKETLLNKQGYLPKILVIVPASIKSELKGTTFEYELDETSVIKSKEIAKTYKELAIKHNCLYLDNSSSNEVSKIDCEHLTLKGHDDLSNLVYDVIKKA